MKKIKKKGFTLIEMMVVIGLMAILLLIIVGSFSRQKVKSRDNMRISGLQEIRLAVEEYKLVCGVYPSKLDPSTNNGRYGICSGHTFEDFLAHIPENPLYASDANPTGQVSYYYRGLSNNSTNPCYEYYLAVQLEDLENKNLQKDHDWNRTGSYKKTCKGAETSLNTYSDDEGWYDFRSQKGL